MHSNRNSARNLTDNDYHTDSSQLKQYSRFQRHDDRSSYGHLQPSNRLPVGWNAQESMKQMMALPKTHTNYEKPALNRLDVNRNHIFVE